MQHKECEIVILFCNNEKKKKIPAVKESPS